MFKYGFELEGFAVTGVNDVVIPPDDWPVDGFPGLVELRTVGPLDLHRAWADILMIDLKTRTQLIHTNYEITEHKFSGMEMSTLRATRDFSKRQLKVCNIYNKAPRRTGNRTLASLQINISNMLSNEYRKVDGTFVPAAYGLLDVHGIVRRLDQEFKTDITNSKRQPGMYAIKDSVRLEYRSLPNSVFEFNAKHAKDFLNRIECAVEEK